LIFDYNTLKKAAREGTRLGNWNGKAVFAASAADLENKGSGAFYILYDDENKIVGRSGSGWKSYGVVSKNGGVNEYNAPKNYNIDMKTASKAKKGLDNCMDNTVSSYTPGYDVSEPPVADIKLTIDIDSTLKKAREMTIADLLKGFDYGLDEIVG
jgi:hypothetical protein